MAGSPHTAFQQPHPVDAPMQRQSDAEMNVYVGTPWTRAQYDVYLAQNGLLPNAISADEQPPAHSKTHLAVTVVGVTALAASDVGMVNSIAAIRRHIRRAS